MRRGTFLSILFFLVMSMDSCFKVPFVPHRHKKNFTYCFQDTNTGIDALININGYFRMGIWSGIHTYGYGSKTFQEDTNYVNFLFFRNGICVKFYDPKYLKEAVTDATNRKNDLFHTSFDWGCYRIFADTIMVQRINHPSMESPIWMLGEERFKIIDKNTLKCIFIRNLHGDKKVLYDAKMIHENTYTSDDGNTYTLLPAKFISVPAIPSSDCWLKRKKWFWCDKGKYAAWKKTKMR